MMKKVILCLIAVLALSQQSYAQQEPFKNETAFEAVRNMGIGWNLGNSLDSHKEGTLPNITDWEQLRGNPIVTRELIHMMKVAGCKTIRVPVTWYPHLDANFNIDPAWLDRVEEVVDYVLDEGMYCIIDVHHDTGKATTEYPKKGWLDLDLFTHALKYFSKPENGRLTYVYASYSGSYGFDGTYMGEPVDGGYDLSANPEDSPFYKIWYQIASKFANKNHRLIFEGWNEMFYKNHFSEYSEKLQNALTATYGGPSSYNYQIIDNFYDYLDIVERGTDGYLFAGKVRPGENNNMGVVRLQFYASLFLNAVYNAGGNNRNRNLILPGYGSCYVSSTQGALVEDITRIPLRASDSQFTTSWAHNGFGKYGYSVDWNLWPVLDYAPPAGDWPDHIISSFHPYPNLEGKTDAEIDVIALRMATLLGRYADKLQVPTICGEFGGAAVDQTPNDDYTLRKPQLLRFAKKFVEYLEDYAHRRKRDMSPQSEGIDNSYCYSGVPSTLGKFSRHIPVLYWMRFSDKEDRAVPQFTRPDLVGEFMKGYYGEKYNLTTLMQHDVKQLAVTEANIPDATFRNYLLNNYTITNIGGVPHITTADVVHLNLSGLQIANLSGIEYFKSLKTLDISRNTVFTKLSFPLNTSIETIIFYQCSNLEELDLSNLLGLKYVQTTPNQETASNNNPGLNKLRKLKITNLKQFLGSAGKRWDTYRGLDLSQHGSQQFSNEQYYYESLEEVDLSGCVLLECFSVYSSKLKSLNLTNCKRMNALYINNGFLTPDDINVTGVPEHNFDRIVLPRHQISDMTKIYNMMASDMTTLQLNGGKYNRQQYSNDPNDINTIKTNLIKEINSANLPKTIELFQVRHNLLTYLDLGSSFNKLRQIHINNNMLWCADLSGARFPATYDLGKKYQLQVYAQKPHVDLQVVKGAAEDGSEDEIRIYVPSEASPIFNSANLDKTTMVYNGKALPETSFVDNGTEKYWKVGSVAADNIKADLDMYNKPNMFSYKYNTGAFSNASTVGYDPIAVGLFNTPDVTSIDEARIMDVNVTVYPYIMYVHPATKSGVNYYSGTLWLDYNSVVPPGTTAYIATGVKKDYVIDSNQGTDVVDYQLVLEELGGPGNGGPGAIVPAGTAIFVRSNTKAGLYAFQKAWEVDYQGWEGETVNSGPDDNVIVGEKYTPAQLAEIERTLAWIGDRNLLEGAGVPTEFAEKRQCLTLGRNDQRGTMMIGFWPYNGTVVAPHRAFIREARYREALSKLQGSNSGAGSTGNLTGATFYFGEDDSEPLIIETIDSGVPVASESWYTMNGQRLFGRPTKQGVYIHNGKKVYIK